MEIMPRKTVTKKTYLRQKVTVLIVLMLSLVGIFYVDSKILPKDPKKDAFMIMKACQGSKDTRACYSKNFYGLTKNTNIYYSIEVLHSLQAIDSSSLGCHLIAHYMARAEMGKDSSRWKSLVNKIPHEECLGGYLHGVIEAMIDENYTSNLNKSTIKEICQEIKDPRDCEHIMGHLVLVQEEGSIEKALEICGDLPDKASYRCSAGVFMENVQRGNLIAHGIVSFAKWDDKFVSNIEATCNKFSGLLGEACWHELAAAIAPVVNYNPEEIHDYCLRAPNENAKNKCYMNGIAISFRSPKFNFAQSPQLCAPFSQNSRKYEDCLLWLLERMVKEKFVDQAQRFCTNTEESYRNFCRQELSSLLSN